MFISLHSENLRGRWLFGWLLSSLLAACVATPVEESGMPSGKADSSSKSIECVPFGDAVTVGRIDDSSATEISGIAASRMNPGVLWAHNDGGGKHLKLYALDHEGRLVRKISVSHLALTDVEDIAIGPGPEAGRDYLYLADIGDNANNRKHVQVIRFPEPLLDTLDTQDPVNQDDVEVFRFRYDDKDPHDAEALLVAPTSGQVFIITKQGPDEGRTRIYASRPNLRTDHVNILDEVLRDKDAPWFKGSATAADISSDGHRIAVAFKDEATRTWVRSPGENIEQALARPACLSPSAPGQQEALAFSVDGSGYFLVPEGKNPRISFVAQRSACPEYAAPEAIATLTFSALEEVSGLVLSHRFPDVLWAVNDSGKGVTRNVLTALNTDGELLASVALSETRNLDWEDIAIGPGPVPGRGYLYIGDIGDNERQRDSIVVYRFLEPRPGETPITVDTLRFRYPSGKAHDAESLLVDPISGDLFIVTRRRTGRDKTRIYRASAPLDASAVHTLEKVLGQESSPQLAHSIVGADISSDGLLVALLRRDGKPVIYERNPNGPAWLAISYRGCAAQRTAGKQDAIALDLSGGFYQLAEGTNPVLFHSKHLP